MSDSEIERLEKYLSELPPEAEITEDIIRYLCNYNEIQDEEIKSPRKIQKNR